MPSQLPFLSVRAISEEDFYSISEKGTENYSLSKI
jgi:hypothetical protein